MMASKLLLGLFLGQLSQPISKFLCFLEFLATRSMIVIQQHIHAKAGEVQWKVSRHHIFKKRRVILHIITLFTVYKLAPWDPPAGDVPAAVVSREFQSSVYQIWMFTQK